MQRGRTALPRRGARQRIRTRASNVEPGERMTNPSLKHKMLRLTLLTSVAALLIAGAVFFTYEYFHLHAELEEDTQALGRLVARESAPAMAQADRGAAQRLLDALVTQEHVVAATLLDTRERVMARYVRRDTETAPVAGQGSGRLDGLVWSRQPLHDGGREVGTLLIANYIGYLLIGEGEFAEAEEPPGFYP